MILNFRSETYQRLKFLAEKKGRSVASYVESLCNQHVNRTVSANYSLKEEKDHNDEIN